MKNFADVSEDKLDKLPQRRPIHQCEKQKGCGCRWCYERHGNDFPYARVNRFLMSAVGRSWNKVVSEYVHCDWVPAEHRTYSKLCDFVEVNTFMKGNKVMVHKSYYYSAPISVNDALSDVFYVHPTSGLLCYKARESKAKRRARYNKQKDTFRILGDYDQLLKLDGVWYHVWAQPEADPRIAKRYRKDAPLLYDSSGKHRAFYGPLDPNYIEFVFNRPKIYKVQLSTESLKQYGLKNDTTGVVWNICKKCGSNNCSLHHAN